MYLGVLSRQDAITGGLISPHKRASSTIAEAVSHMEQVIRTVGRYELLAELGRGSMGVVYRAHDPNIGRTVAIKMLLTQRMAAADCSEYLERFHREAQSAGALAHPNIVTIYDFGEDQGNYYLAMEFLEGKSLERLVQEQPLLPVETIIPIFDQVSSALDVAHAHGIVHRDVKPANIMILESGQVKVTDFGIAKVMAAEMTQAGQVLGTPNYMSPEQVLNRPLDGRSDIFSLGAILYELVTGEKPFSGQNITTVIYKIIHEMPIPPRELDPQIHPGLSYVIAKALAKSPDERYQTCSALASDLRNYKNIEGVVIPGATIVMSAPAVLPRAASGSAASAVAPAGATATAPTPDVQPPATQAAQAAAAAPVARVKPPAKRALRLPAMVWALSALIVLGAATAYYFLFFRNTNPAAPVAASQPVNPPATGAAPPPTTAPAAKMTEVASKAPAADHAKSAPASKAQGELQVSSKPKGAEIFIDDDDYGAAPKHLRLLAGAHKLALKLDGMQAYSEDIQIKAGKALHKNVELEAATKAEPSTAATSAATPGAPSNFGTVHVVTSPAGARVMADESFAGTTPAMFSLPAGRHKLILSITGHPPIRVDIDVTAGATNEVNKSFENQ